MPKSAGQLSTFVAGTGGRAQAACATAWVTAVDRMVTLAGNEKVEPFCGKASVRFTVRRSTSSRTLQSGGPVPASVETPVVDRLDGGAPACRPAPADPLEIVVTNAEVSAANPNMSEAVARNLMEGAYATLRLKRLPRSLARRYAHGGHCLAEPWTEEGTTHRPVSCISGRPTPSLGHPGTLLERPARTTNEPACTIVQQSLTWMTRRNCKTANTGEWLSGPSEWGTSGWASPLRASSSCRWDPRRGSWPSVCSFGSQPRPSRWRGSSGPGKSYPSHVLGSGRCASCSSMTRFTPTRRHSALDGSFRRDCARGTAISGLVDPNGFRRHQASARGIAKHEWLAPCRAGDCETGPSGAPRGTRRAACHGEPVITRRSSYTEPRTLTDSGQGTTRIASPLPSEADGTPEVSGVLRSAPARARRCRAARRSSWACSRSVEGGWGDRCPETIVCPFRVREGG